MSTESELAPISNSQSRATDWALGKLRKLVLELTGTLPDDHTSQANFVELGVDSLLMVQLVRAIEENFGVKVKFDALLERYSTLVLLAEHIAQSIPEGVHQALMPVNAPSSISENALPKPAPLPNTKPTSAPELEINHKGIAAHRSAGLLEKVIAEQLESFTELTRQQLAFMQGRLANSAGPSARLGKEVTLRSQSVYDPNEHPGAEVIKRNPDPFESFRTSSVEPPSRALTPEQQVYLTGFIESYNRRTQRSKQHAQTHRQYLADGRASVSFRRPLKEMLYPIVCIRSEGARVWDLDENEYVDLAMGFGVHLFGHTPGFISEAIQEQLKHGISIGFQPELAGKVAKMLCDLTGHERAVFANSGTEAVMAALRVARANTRRDQIALFRGSYHGWSDLTLARRIGSTHELRSIPLAPGVSTSAANDILVLDYDSEESLEVLQSKASQLAAILVEPVQSRNPLLRPQSFLEALRRLADQSGSVLIFDETVTGFRVHPRGAQGLLGVRPDLSIYGKSIGGGMPVGVLAGKAALMDVLDGGQWRYGDQSYPSREKTFFAGTFCKHPLALAAMEAVLKRLTTEGSSLQEGLNARTSAFVETLNESIRELGAPITIEQCGSLFLFVLPSERYARELFVYHLIQRGVYVWEGRSCFLSTAHTREDLTYAARAFHATVRELQNLQFLASKHQATTVSRPQKVPLTQEQLNIILASQLSDKDDAVYNESIILDLQGALDSSTLRAAVSHLVQRHESMRATVLCSEEALCIRDAISLEMPYHDLSSLSPAERDHSARKYAHREASTPFNLAKGPLFRMLLLKLGPERYEFIFTSHHLIADGWSVSILLRELRTLYAELSAGTSPSLPRAMQFSDYIEWRQEKLKSAESVEAQNYWREQFAAPIAALELPPPKMLSSSRHAEGRRVSITLTEAYVERIRSFAAENGCTVFMVLLSAYISFLHRWTGQQDVVVGIPSAGQASAYDSVVGCCLNILPIRSTVDMSWTFKEHLDRVRTLVSIGRHYAEYAPYKAATDSALRGDTSRSALVNTVFNLDESSGSIDFEGIRLTPRTNWNQTCKFNLELNGTIRNGALTLDMSGKAVLFDAVALERNLARLLVLLERSLTNPGTPLKELPIIGDIEKHLIVRDWNSTEAAYPNSSIHREFSAQVRARPEAMAVIDHGRQVTYRDLNACANSLAEVLQSRSTGAEQVVAIEADRSLEFIVAVLATLKIGGVYLPLDPRSPERRRREMIEDSRAKLVLQLRENHLYIDGEQSPIWGYETHKDKEPAEICFHSWPDNLAYVNYTSGSTGIPKGVAVTHRGVLRLVCGGSFISWHRDDRLAHVNNVSFDATTFDLWGPLLNGGTVVIVSRDELLDPPKFSKILQQEKISVLFLTAGLFSQIARDGGHVLSEVKRVAVGGDVLDPGAARKFLTSPGSGRLINGYGPTECTTFAVSYEISPGREDTETIPIGRPISNTSAYVVDSDMKLVPIGSPGELCLGGAGLARGYLGLPGLTADRFVPDPFGGKQGARLYRTGDRCRYLSDGTLEFLGRADRQVKIRGFRVEPGEIEAAMSRCAEVEEVAIEIDASEAEKPRLAAYVIPAGQLPSALEVWPSLQEYDGNSPLAYHGVRREKYWTQRYMEAVHAAGVSKRILDVGLGRPPLLGNLCRQAGAKCLLQALVNNEGDLVSEMHTHRNDVSSAVQTATKEGLVDVLILEMVGPLARGEGIAQRFRALRRCLAPDGVVIPRRCSTRVAAAMIPDELRRDPRFGPAAEEHVRHLFSKRGRRFDLRCCIKGFPKSHLMSASEEFDSIEFTKSTDPEIECARDLTLRVEKEGRIDGLLLWLALDFWSGICLDTSEEHSVWLPHFFPCFSPGFEVVAGDILSIRCATRVGSDLSHPDYFIEAKLRRQNGDAMESSFSTTYDGLNSSPTPFHRALLSSIDDSIGGLSLRLQRQLSERLPDYMMPAAFVPMAAFPLTTNGKLDRKALPVPQYEVWNGSCSETARVPTEIEAKLIAIWSEVLKRKDVGIYDDLFDLGGDSLTAMRIASRMSESLDTDVPLSRLFECRTISLLAEMVKGLSDIRTSPTLVTT